MFEFYDFAMLSFYADHIGSAVFPPSLSGTQHTLCVFGLFWAGFLSRPLGGGIFGHIADVLGRKRALRLSMFAIAASSFLTGCVPTYHSVGYLSPTLLLVLRLFMGMSIGGEVTSAFVFMFESAPSDRRALWMSFLTLSSMGVFLATLTRAAIDCALSEAQIAAWGWRLPFWNGIALCALGCYSKWALEETPIFGQIMETETAGKMVGWTDVGDANAFKVAFCNHLGITLVVIGASALNHWTPYLFGVFIPQYLESEEMHGWSDHNSYRDNVVLMLIGCAAVIATGYVADQYGALRYVHGTL